MTRVSSGLYAPMPFANADLADYSWNQPVRVVTSDDADGEVEICAESGVLCSGPPHFVRVDAEQADGGWNLSVRVGGHGGALLDPLGPPPDGVECGERSWHVRLSRLGEGQAGVKEPGGASVGRGSVGSL